MTLSDSSCPSGRILVFDSGVGGLTVAAEVEQRLPECEVHYAADTGFFPYGNKSDEALRARLPAVAEALVEVCAPDVFVIACNTASTLALSEVRERLSIPVVGTVPAIKPAIQLSQTGVIGLLATPGTLRRSYTDALIEEFANKAHVIKHGSIDLVHLAEAYAAGDPVSDAAVRAAQHALFDHDQASRMDTVVLACTHFPLLRDQLQATAPHPCQYIDSGEAIARQTARLLEKKDINAPRVSKQAFITSPPDGAPMTVKTLERFGYRLSEPVAVGRKGTTSPEVA